MVRLTTNTRINKHGEEIDASLYLIRFDTRNLAIVEGVRGDRGYVNGQVKGYYGSIKSALQKSIDIVIRDAGDVCELSNMVQAIDSLTERIEELCTQQNYPNMMQLLRGEIHE